MSALRGEIRTYGPHKIAVISADPVNSTGRPWCAPIVRQADVPATLAAFAVTTNETDAVSGVILLLEARTLDAEQLGPPLGTLVGVTLGRIEDGIKTMFDIA